MWTSHAIHTSLPQTGRLRIAVFQELQSELAKQPHYEELDRRVNAHLLGFKYKPLEPAHLG